MTTLDFAPTARLHRKGKATWIFSPVARYGELVHVTNKGTVYAILSDHKCGKPFWIGRLMGNAWCTVERDLRATEIVFDDGGTYTFPK